MTQIKFKYHPNLYTDEILQYGEAVCDCCQKKVTEYIDQVYAAEDLQCICLECVHNGKAAKKFDATFVANAQEVSDPEIKEELFCRTPGYMAWQGEEWIACCNDYCEYLGTVGIKELEELGIKEEALNDLAENCPEAPMDFIREYLRKDGDMTGYLFRCLHCGKYHLNFDGS